MTVFYHLSIPIYIPGRGKHSIKKRDLRVKGNITPRKKDADGSRGMSKTGKEEAGGPHGGNGVRKGKEGLHVNDTPRKGPILKVIREHAFLDWMVLSMLMLLLGLVYLKTATRTPVSLGTG